MSSKVHYATLDDPEQGLTSGRSQELLLDAGEDASGQENSADNSARSDEVNLLLQVKSGLSFKPNHPEDGFAHWARHRVQESEFYHSIVAWRIRSLMQGRICTGIMLCALAAALLLPDLSKLLEIPSNVWTDLVMSVAMSLFLCEMLALSFTDANYLFSFFHIMDFIGTASMVFDISFLLGGRANEPHFSNESSSSPVLLLRASRAARVSARAGRLTRILRVCRFLMDYGDMDESSSSNQETKKTSIANVISVQLSTLLATRVASLVIFLVMVMPLFDVMSFPQKDFALETWVEQVSMVNQEDEAMTTHELRKMAHFFSSHSYGPFAACTGRLIDGDVFICEKYFKDWGQVHTEPVRIASELLVHTDTFLVNFNMARPVKVKAAVNLMSSFFTIVVMVVFGLALSNAVTDLAVSPLERMLGTVREMASTVFRFSSSIGQEEDVQETTDIDNAGEMILLEKVVEKLAAIASVQASAENVDTEGMDNEDIGVLNMLKGNRARGIRSTSKQKTQDELEIIERRKETKKTRGFRPQPTLSFQKDGVDEDTYDSFAFDAFALSNSQLGSLAFYIMVSANSGSTIMLGEEEEDKVLQRFCAEVQKVYQPNPFHSFAHAIDVLANTVRIQNLMEADTFLSDLEQFSLLIAALGHDMAHPGKNNVFLSEVGHELAIKYNDNSPLENMHCSLLYQMLVKPETALLKNLSPEDYKEARKVIVEAILHTDMIGHQSMVKELSLMYQINSEVFRASGPGGRSSRKSTIYAHSIAEPVEVFKKPENRALSIYTILHSADVSNPAREWAVTKRWAEACIEEFFAQGDQEKALGIPVQFLNDRDKLNRPNSQIGFIEFMIAPFFAAQIWLWPALFEFGDHMATNISNWEAMWLEETKPTEEEAEKVHARVAKVKETLSYASLRIAS